MPSPRKLEEMYKQGINVSKALRGEKDSQFNDEEIIELTYDVLTGHYINQMRIPEVNELWTAFNHEVGDRLLELGDITSVLETGVGEATTLAGVLDRIGASMEIYASDISWSRVAYARTWLAEQGYANAVNLHTASMFHLPLPSCSVDVVYTAHSVEPNGGRERAILEELYRVAKRYLVLVEPAYDLANVEQRQRMVEHGYCVSLFEHVGLLGYNVLEHKLMDVQKNPLNPVAYTLIEKDSNVLTRLEYVCPQYKTKLYHLDNMYYSDEAKSVYPVVMGIPCLKADDSVVASKYTEVLFDDNSLYTV